jgi:hypothetical protein
MFCISFTLTFICSPCAGLPDETYICIPKNPDVGIFWKALEWKIFDGLLAYYIHFAVIWHTMSSFGIFCCHLVYYVVIWYIMLSFGIFCCHLGSIFCGHLVYISWTFGIFQEKSSGNPANMCVFRDCKQSISASLSQGFQNVRVSSWKLGCQIFRDAIYQSEEKYTKLPLHKLPTGHKIY